MQYSCGWPATRSSSAHSIATNPSVMMGFSKGRHYRRHHKSVLNDQQRAMSLTCAVAVVRPMKVLKVFSSAGTATNSVLGEKDAS